MLAHNVLRLVRQHVDVQVLLHLEGLAAAAADKRLGLGVHVEVLLQRAGQGEGLAAHQAHVGLVRAVLCLVLLVGRLPAETLVTHAAGVGVLPLIYGLV